jgi:hypothetical protein
MKFTPAIAASFGAKGGIASGVSRNREIEAEPPAEEPTEEPQETKPIPLPAASSISTFKNRILKRTRRQMKRVFDAIDLELDAKKLNPVSLRALYDSLARAEEIERRLSGRGLPANVKPERAGRRDAGAMPLGIDLADEPDEPPTPQAPSLPAGLPPPVGVSLPDLSKLGE